MTTGLFRRTRSPVLKLKFVMLALAGLLVCGLLNHPATASDRYEMGAICGGMEWDMCNPSERAELQKAYYQRPLEIYKGERTEVVRAYRQNANSWNELALIFSRDFNGVPQVEIRRPLLWDGSNWQAPLLAKMTEAVWKDVIEKGKGFDDAYVFENLCMDGHTSMIEFIDGSETIRRRVEHSCSEGPGNRYFEYLTAVAVAQFPYCAAIEPEDTSPSDATRLLSCFTFDGDRMAAAELHNLLEKVSFWSSRNSKDSAQIEHLFDQEIEFAWPGLPPINSATAAAKAWIESTNFLQRFYGETRDRVRVEGRATVRHTETDDLTEEVTVPYSTTWLRGRNGQFHMRSASYDINLMQLKRSYTREQHTRMRAKPGKMPPRTEILSASDAVAEASPL